MNDRFSIYYYYYYLIYDQSTIVAAAADVVDVVEIYVTLMKDTFENRSFYVSLMRSSNASSSICSVLD